LQEALLLIISKTGKHPKFLILAAALVTLNIRNTHAQNLVVNSNFAGRSSIAYLDLESELIAKLREKRN